MHGLHLPTKTRRPWAAPLLLLLAAGLLVSACAPLMRGMNGDNLASSARPSVEVRAASGLSLLGSGAVSPTLDTELGPRFADAGWAFYADPSRQRQLAVVLAEVPNGWQWELDLSSNFREVRRDVYVTGGAPFSGATLLLPASRDPFAPLLPAPPKLKADEGEWRWLVRRYTALYEFRSVKLQVEYREPLPAGAGEDLANALDAGEQPYGPAGALLGEFEARARAAFAVVSGGEGMQPAAFVHDRSKVQVRRLGEMVGRMEPVQRLVKDDK